MKFFVKTKLSDNISETPEGYLLCKNVPLTHTGTLTYVKGEHPFEEIDTLEVTRTKEELFSDKTISSFMGKSITIEHPKDFVTPETWQQLTNGNILNVRPSPEQIEVEGKKEDALLGDFLITTKDAIKAVKDGLREVSLGYDALWVETGKNKAVHTNIVGNHVALVNSGRAGKDFAIKDTKENFLKTKILKLLGKALDEGFKGEKEEKEYKDPKVSEIEAKIKALQEELAEAKKSESKDDDDKMKDDDKAKDDGEPTLAEIKGLLEKLLGMEKKEAGLDAEEKEEKADDEVEEVVDADEEKEEKKEKAGDSKIDEDTKARAEILAPGIALTKDVKTKALETAYKTKDGKKIIDILTEGKKLSEVKDHSVIFIAAAQAMKAKRVNDFSKATTMASAVDAFPAFKQSNVTTDDLNKKNAEFYKLN